MSMAKPNLTPEQIQTLNKEKFSKANKATILLQGAKLQDSEIAKKQSIEDAFKAQFNWYQNSIIGQYNNEKKSICGVFAINEVNETDIVNASALPPSGRLVPTPPITDIVRVPEAFNGTSTSSTDVNELYFISKQIVVESVLKNGPRYNGGTIPVTTPSLIANPISATDTQITFTTTNPTETPVFHIGDKFLLKDGTNQVCIEITSIISQTPGGSGFCTGDTPPGAIDQATCLLNGGTWTPPSNFSAVLGFSFIVFSQALGQSTVDENWHGFSDSDRAAKNDSTNGYNSLLNNLISSLQSKINDRIARLNEQIQALTTNDDPAKDVSQITICDASKSFLVEYLVNTVIGDNDQGLNKGLNSLISERTSRTTQANNRVTAIGSALTSLYDVRYTLANNRANASYGSLRELTNASTTKTQMQAMAAELQKSIDSLNTL